MASILKSGVFITMPYGCPCSTVAGLLTGMEVYYYSVTSYVLDTKQLESTIVSFSFVYSN